MKKFQFAAGLLALGLLASCSSDAPELATNTPNNGGNFGDDAYVALRINTSEVTRATETEHGSDDENEINSLTMFLVDGTSEVPVMILDADKFTKPNNQGEAYAYFNVGTIRLERLKTYTDASHQIKVKVVANVGTTNNANYNNVEDWTKKTFAEWTASSIWSETEGSDPDNFMMSNNNGVTGYFSNVYDVRKDKDGNTINGKDENNQDKTTWILNGGEDNALKINLTRLATRFDLAKTVPAVEGDAEEVSYYTATKDGITYKITVEGVQINTHETSAWVWKQTNTPGAAVNYSTKGDDDEVNSTLAAHTYTLALDGTGKRYAFPHTVSALPGKGGNNYYYGSYLAVKASFTCDDTDLIPENCTETLYAYDGKLLGTYTRIKGLSTAGLDAGLAALIESAKALNDEPSFRSKYINNDQVDVYDNTNGKYYTYYNRLIVNEVKTQKDKGKDVEVFDNDNVDLFRNTIYKLKINAFSGLGQQGTNKPHDPTDGEKVYVDLDVKVVDWDVNKANNGMTFGR